MGRISVKSFPISVLFIGLSACQPNSSPQQACSGNDIVINAALTNPLFKCVGCVDGDSGRYSEFISEVLEPIVTVNDDSLGLTLSLHTYSSVSGTYPPAIIYIVQKDRFKYAFQFVDERNYLDYPHLVSDENLRTLLTDRNQLEDQLNIIVARLRINRFGNEEQLKHFIDIFFKSLLGTFELTSSNVDSIVNELSKTISFVKGDPLDSCVRSYKQNLLQIKNEIDTRKAVYFSTYKGIHSFWRIRIDTVNTSLHIGATLANYQCYTTIGL
jgi:hypothetical protein